MLKWEDKTDFFSEERRHWCGRYLLQCEVASDEIEVTLDGMVIRYLLGTSSLVISVV